MVPARLVAPSLLADGSTGVDSASDLAGVASGLVAGATVSAVHLPSDIAVHPLVYGLATQVTRKMMKQINP